MRRILLFGVLLAVVAALAFGVYRFYPREVDFEADGMKYRLGAVGAAEERPVRVIIKGKVWRNWNGDRKFVGTVDLKGEEIPVPEDARDVTVNFNHGTNFGVVVYGWFPNGTARTRALGILHVSDDFSAVAIQFYEYEDNGGSWTSGDGLIIAAPASNREEAVALSNELMRDSLAGIELK
jgi:hypothetical protein